VVLATNDPLEHLNFLTENQFESNSIKILIQNLKGKKENKSETVIDIQHSSNN
jgi:hypothetical protein